MSNSGDLHCELPSNATVLPDMRQRVRDWCVARGWSDHQIGDITLAIDEALSNVIRHGYCGDTAQRIDFTLTEHDDPQLGPGLEVRIRDFCHNVDLEAICGRSLDDVRPGGLGVHLIHAMMESVSYSHAEGGGLLLVMRKSQQHVSRARDEEEGSTQ